MKNNYSHACWGYCDQMVTTHPLTRRVKLILMDGHLLIYLIRLLIHTCRLPLILAFPPTKRSPPTSRLCPGISTSCSNTVVESVGEMSTPLMLIGSARGDGGGQGEGDREGKVTLKAQATHFSPAPQNGLAIRAITSIPFLTRT